MKASTVTTKGQVVIPALLRKKVGIKPGTTVFLEEKNGDVVIHPATPNFFERHYGLLKGKGLIKLLERERAKEKEHEEENKTGKSAKGIG